MGKGRNHFAISYVFYVSNESQPNQVNYSSNNVVYNVTSTLSIQ